MSSPEYVKAAQGMLTDSMVDHAQMVEQWCRPTDVFMMLSAFSRDMIELIAVFELQGLTPDEVLEATRKAAGQVMEVAAMSEELAQDQVRAGDTVPLTPAHNKKKRELEWARVKDLHGPSN